MGGDINDGLRMSLFRLSPIASAERSESISLERLSSLHATLASGFQDLR